MLVENKVLAEFAELIREKKTQPYSGELKTGVDLGTANIVIAVTDSENRPVAGASAPSHVFVLVFLSQNYVIIVLQRTCIRFIDIHMHFQ